VPQAPLRPPKASGALRAVSANRVAVLPAARFLPTWTLKRLVLTAAWLTVLRVSKLLSVAMDRITSSSRSGSTKAVWVGANCGDLKPQ